MNAKANTVSHPKHYVSGRKHEPIDVIRDWNLDYCLGNVVKYISRFGRKSRRNKLEDLEKAQFYLRYRIEEEKRKERNKVRRPSGA